jgi:threonine dehydrogenase-like Zn-dependent dehydrogenase
MHPDRFVLEERPIPVPGPGQVLARTLACGICGSDLHLYRHAADMLEMGRAAGVPEEVLSKGVVLGHEFIAEVAGFGPDTRQRLAVGARVTSIPFIKGDLEAVPMGSTPYVDGAYAEYFLLSEESLIPVPEDLPTDAAALTEPLAIGIHAVNKPNLEANPVAIVMGCGPIGLAVIAALRLRGIKHIIAGDFSAKRRELAEAMGATIVVDAAQGSPFDRIPQALALSPAVAFECTGVTGMIGRIIEQIPARSEIVVAGIAHGSDSFTPMQAIARELSIHFVSFYQQAEFRAALDALADGSINWRPWITGKVDLEGVAAAFEELKDPERHAKILIYPNGE